MTSSERRVGLVRRLLDPPGEARPDWRILAGLARALGFGEHFAWPDEAAVFDEFAGCTAGRPCDITGLSHERLRREGGVQWPCPSGDEDGGAQRPRRSGGEETSAPSAAANGTVRLYEGGRVATPDGRARFAPTPHAPPADALDAEHPLLLTTGRIADQWHTMTRTGKSRALRAAAGEPTVELSAEDAAAAGLRDGDGVRVVGRRGEVVVRARVVEGMPPGVAFAPFHWGALHAPPGTAAVNAITPAATDPVSGQPELKAVAVRVEPAGRAPLARRGARRMRRRLVVIGTGMAGQAVAEGALARRPADEWRITLLGDEPGLPYNRILVSKLLAGTCGPGDLELRPAGWYTEHGVEVRGGCGAICVDTEARLVRDAAGVVHPYDALVLATGSRPFVPPVPGVDAPHVIAFRTPRDVDALRGAADGPTVVVGGGLLGLEAAAGLLGHGVPVTVVELAPRLMSQQMGAGAAAMLERALRGQGMRFALGRSVAHIGTEDVTLDDGARLPASLVVVAAGVRPNVALARAAGIECARGVVVDDELRASAPGVWAVGECAEHRGTVYGLWAPLGEQARIAAAVIAGDPAAFPGATPATTLKVSGVDVFTGGVAAGAPDDDEIVARDTRRGVYRKLVLSGDRLAGVVLVGDTTHARVLSELLRTGEPVPQSPLEADGQRGLTPLSDDDPAAIVCSCNGVTRETIAAAIRRGGLRTLAQVGNATRAATGCGSCAGDVERLLAS